MIAAEGPLELLRLNRNSRLSEREELGQAVDTLQNPNS
jgi:hypothetical protein